MKLLRQLEEGKKNAFSYYLPMREAVVRYCGKSGKDFDNILSQMIRRAETMPCSPNQDICGDNKAAFKMFASEFYPRITKYKGDLLRDNQSGVTYEGVTVLGAPHFIAQDEGEDVRYVFLYASNWSSEDLKTYLQLLSMIVENKYRATARQIWCMDLRKGKDFNFKESVRVSSKCADALKLYAQLRRAMDLGA